MIILKIVQINSHYSQGSIGRICRDINQQLINLEYESYIIYGRGRRLRKKNIYKVGNILTVNFHVMMTRVFDLHGYFSFLPTLKLIRLVKRINPDVIHMHNIHGYYLNYKLFFNFLSKFKGKIVWTLHDCWSFTGHCAYFDFSKCDKWKTSCNNCPEKKTYPKSLFFDNSNQNFKKKKLYFNKVPNITIVTPSFWLENKLKYSFLNKFDSIVINNGVNLNVFREKHSNFRDTYNLGNKKIILGVANLWDRRKGLEHFVSLSDILGNDEVIVLVGLERKQLKNLKLNMIGINRTNNIEELADIYASSDVFVNLTLEDNYPTTNLEALACGTPVVTYNTGGSIEIITRRNGFIVEQGDFTEIRRILDNIFYDSSFVNSFFTDIKKLDNNVSILKYIDLYRSVLKGK